MTPALLDATDRWTRGRASEADVVAAYRASVPRRQRTRAHLAAVYAAEVAAQLATDPALRGPRGRRALRAVIEPLPRRLAVAAVTCTEPALTEAPVERALAAQAELMRRHLRCPLA